MKTCPSCGERLSDEAKFCPVDGTSLQGVASTPGAPPPAAGSPFAKTLFGAVPPPPVAPGPVIDPDVPFDTRGRPGVRVDLDVSVAPSDAAAPVPVPTYTPPPPSPAASSAVSIERLPSKGPRTRNGARSSSMSFERRTSTVGLAIGAALGGAAVVSVLMIGVKSTRKKGAQPAPAAALSPSPPATPAVAPPPPPPPVPAVVPAVPRADGGAAQATATAGPAATTAGASPTGAATTTPVEPTRPSDTPAQSPPGGGDPRQADLYVRAGREHLSRGAYAKARSAFEQARAYDPTNSAALAGLGEAAFEEGDYAAAVDKLRAATRLSRNSRYLTLLGNSYFKLGQFKQAVEQYKRALQLDAANAEAKEGLEASQKKLRGVP